jgi:phage shock protein C
MQSAQPSLFARNDTLFGVCEGLGEDFGFNPLFLRIGLAVGLLWNPIFVIGGYAAAGVAVALSRWLVPNPAVAKAVAGGPATAHKTPAGDNDADAEVLAAAA